MRNHNLFTALATGICVLAVATPVCAQARSFNIPAGSLKVALDSYARQSGRPVIYKADHVRGLRSRGFRGTATNTVALDAVLLNTGLSARADVSGAVAIVPAPSPAREGAGNQALPNAEIADAAEIVVTAQKREQRLQDVPVPVSVVNPAELARNNQVRLQDFASTVPGLSVMSLGNGGLTSVTIRGISSGAYTPATVAITVDDVPSYSGLASALTAARPDLDCQSACKRDPLSARKRDPLTRWRKVDRTRAFALRAA